MTTSWKWPVAGIVGLTLVIELAMAMTDMGPAVALVAALCALVGIGVWCVRDLLNLTTEESMITSTVGTDLVLRTDRRVMRLRTGLTYARREDAQLESLRSELVDLIDDQLRAVHHIDRSVEPERARAVIGDELTSFLSSPKAANMLAQPHSLARILTRIEQI